MISQSAVFFSWKFLADDFWLCIFASQRSRSRYLPGQPAQVPDASPAAPGRSPRAGPGSRRSSRCSSPVPCSGDPAELAPRWHRWPERDTATSPGPARAGAGTVGVALGHAGYTRIEKLESSFCLSLVHFTDMKIEKGEIYEENLISHSCWMDLVWYWPDFTMCLLKALEYILYVKDCNNFKKKNSW